MRLAVFGVVVSACLLSLVPFAEAAPLRPLRDPDHSAIRKLARKPPVEPSGYHAPPTSMTPPKSGPPESGGAGAVATGTTDVVYYDDGGEGCTNALFAGSSDSSGDDDDSVAVGADPSQDPTQDPSQDPSTTPSGDDDDDSTTTTPPSSGDDDDDSSKTTTLSVKPLAMSAPVRSKSPLSRMTLVGALVAFPLRRRKR